MAGYPQAKFRYKVEIDGLEAGGFSEVTGFDATIEPIEYREGDMTAETPMKIPGLKKYGNITLNQADYTLRGPEKQLPLGKKEYDIMRILMVNREQVVSKETLLLKVWGNDADAVENNVEVYISFLRKPSCLVARHHHE